jgi:hypothetical protein
MEQNRGILADGIKQHRVFRLGNRLTDNMNAFGFQGIEMGEGGD